MAGYASFLGCITCLLVPLFTLNTSDQSSIGYYAIYRVSEICLGVIALLISSMVIWPSSSQDRLAQSLAALRSQLGRLAVMAADPEQYYADRAGDGFCHRHRLPQAKHHRVALRSAGSDSDANFYGTRHAATGAAE
ncbi:FUSC family protein [Endozoicomonas sp. SCSIO W0465]|uniref:FUSC family protein n=1 Tax=Endozoicomonas sp. SCSIO W0465 TaxID=2918516 RepID=UPI0020763BB4|nr:FUSC family protein [Endozoicomonas sp. SCSIO W0465]